AQYFTHTMSLLAHSTSLPMERNGVSLDPEVKDSWGLPAARVTFEAHEDDNKTLLWQQDRSLEILEAAGARRAWKMPVGGYSFQSVHLTGTCRMGNHPNRSVVDSYSRTHDVPNLYLVDGSNFVTSARQQPTATIQALAYRCAEHLVRNRGKA